MKEPINLKLAYKGGCLGCKHLRRMNRFSDVWYCDREYDRDSNGSYMRDNGGKRMKKCRHYEHYQEKRCVDCSLGYISDYDVTYWHCKTDNHCFGYCDKACVNFCGSVEEYDERKRIEGLRAKVQELKDKRRMLVKSIGDIDEEILQIENKINGGK